MKLTFTPENPPILCQLANYAKRKGWDIEKAERWLAPGAIRVRLDFERIAMNITAQLDQLSTAEKISTMEYLWDNLCRHADEVLTERERAVNEGGTVFRDGGPRKLASAINDTKSSRR